MKEDDEKELTGYITMIEPRVYRGLLEYRVRITPPGKPSQTIYMREPPTWIRIGIPVKVKAIKSKQTKEHRYIVDEISFDEHLTITKPVKVVIEEVSKGVATIISGKRNGAFFSITVDDEEILSKIPENLPAEVYCIFIEIGGEKRIASILTEREYSIITKTLRIIKNFRESLGDKR